MLPTIQELFDLKSFIHPALFDGCQYPWEVLPRLHDYLLQKVAGKKQGQIHPQSFVADDADIGEGSVVEPNVVIFGPAIIGKNCVVRAGAYIRGDVLVGNNVVIGHATEVKNSIIMDKVSASHFNYVGDSILGYHVHLAAGVILANTKVPKSEVVVRDVENNYPTGLQKFGAAIGDEAEIGCNSVLNPGSIIGKRSIVYPLVSWRGILLSDMIAKDAKLVVPRTQGK
jgi:NDP-sugar pyrophosphorylase family protein